MRASPPTASGAVAASAEAGGEGDGTALSDYDYDLPEDRIALRPASPRDSARLLVSYPDRIADAVVSALPQFLAPGDRLVVNQSRVIPARLTGRRRRGPSAVRVELTLLSERAPGEWEAFARPAKRLAPGDQLTFPGPKGDVDGTVTARDGGTVWVRFSADPLSAGTMPLPPYIASRRAPDARDDVDYQTVFAARAGSVAAPTAGLHFTTRLMEALEARGVAVSRVTLHVGAGTFLPVTAERIDGHAMHAEFGEIDGETAEAIRATRASGGRIVAVGTTALRLLESAAASGAIAPFQGETRIFIRPGFSFRVTDALMTNFHLPRSTLMMLVAGFIGLPRMRSVYAHAVEHAYRFYSYGDASLLFRNSG